MRPPLRLALAIAALPVAATCQEVLGSEGMAGVGVQGCETVTGVENAPVLAAAVDWGLGYMAGRRDGGHRPVPGEPLSTTDPADVAVGILRYCRENPYGLVLDALRSYGRRVFAEGPEAEPALQPRLPRMRPPARPGGSLPAADDPAQPAGGANAALAAEVAARVAELGPMPMPEIVYSINPAPAAGAMGFVSGTGATTPAEIARGIMAAPVGPEASPLPRHRPPGGG